MLPLLIRLSEVRISEISTGRTCVFNNLIESSSHTKEFKRRGSFIVFTTATYVVLFVITGVVSIYAYDAKLEEQNLEVVTLLPPQEIVPETTPEPVSDPIHDRGPRNTEAFDVRRNPTASVDQPQATPTEISTKPNTNPPVRPGVPYHIGDVDSNTVISGSNRGVPSGTGGVQVNIPDDGPPPAPAPTPAPIKLLKVSEVLNSKALSLPKPPYPTMAKQIRLQGTVTVQVLIDESGKVLSAKAISGHPLLIPESQRAAMQARFSATTVNGQPVKVSGVITYNFVLP
jgi:protein TonB